VVNLPAITSARIVRIAAAATLGALLWTSTARAQPVYVAGSVGADVGRTGSAGGSDAPGTGEAVAFSLRVGTGLTPRFGLELDFTRPSEIETDETLDYSILGVPRNAITPDLLRVLSDVSLPSLPIPDIVGYTVHTAQRATTMTAAAWARQEITPRLSLVYTGGIAFGRVERRITTTFGVPGIPESIYPSTEVRTVEYQAGPMAGFEGRLRVTGHVQLIPGVRVLSLGGGWVVRPAVSLGWMF